MRQHAGNALAALIFLICVSLWPHGPGFFVALAVLALYWGVSAIRAQDKTSDYESSPNAGTDIGNRVRRISKFSGAIFAFYAIAFGLLYLAGRSYIVFYVLGAVVVAAVSLLVVLYILGAVGFVVSKGWIRK